ncbi:MAG TPA: adenylate/guanylate cyclase domain-containing protein [Polyangiaceae bacterium]|nr:adenylate/guanylate cyclase domain-containing protein [Polyangiaceae bacterium]
MSDDARSRELSSWLLELGTGRLEPAALVESLAGKLEGMGVSLFRVSVWIPTKHPELWGNQIVWSHDEGCRILRRAHHMSSSSDYIGTPAERLHEGGTTTLRCRLEPPAEVEFELLRRLTAAGATDYLMVALEEPRFGTAWIAFASRRAGGFGDDDIALLSGIAPLLSLRVQLIAAQLASESLLEVYLGKNASRRVLEGAFRRGGGEEIEAAIWFCDMRGFTALSDRTPAREVVAILDAYFEVLAAAVAEQGGEILKLIGDAMLAVFPVGAAGAADGCRRALAAGLSALESVQAWRERSGLSVELGIALHLGRVMYGNIGGRERLDFTVIGASVNEVCRVESLAKELHVPLLMTAELAAALGRDDVVSLGFHALKGVGERREILTIRSLQQR